MFSFITPLEGNVNLHTEFNFIGEHPNKDPELAMDQELEDSLLDAGFRLAS